MFGKLPAPCPYVGGGGYNGMEESREKGKGKGNLEEERKVIRRKGGRRKVGGEGRGEEGRD